MTLKEALSKADKAWAITDLSEDWVATRQGRGASFIIYKHTLGQESGRYHSIRDINNPPDNIPRGWYVRKSM